MKTISGLMIRALVVSTVLVGCKPSAPQLTEADHAAFDRVMKEKRALIERDENTRESAPWFGTTGLTDDVERHVPRYLRRELGTYLTEPGAVKASDLTYIGSFKEEGAITHFWRIPHPSKTDVYAYVTVTPVQTSTGWGDRRPNDGRK